MVGRGGAGSSSWRKWWARLQLEQPSCSWSSFKHSKSCRFYGRSSWSYACSRRHSISCCRASFPSCNSPRCKDRWWATWCGACQSPSVKFRAVSQPSVVSPASTRLYILCVSHLRLIRRRVGFLLMRGIFWQASETIPGASSRRGCTHLAGASRQSRCAAFPWREGGTWHPSIPAVRFVWKSSPRWTLCGPCPACTRFIRTASTRGWESGTAARCVSAPRCRPFL